jgi:hypothetical protein
MKGDALETLDITEDEFAEDVSTIVPSIAEAFVSGATDLPKSYPNVLLRLFPRSKMLR